MSSAPSLQVKAILLKEGVDEGMKEIRRFRVDEEARQVMPSLLSRVHSVFNVDPSSQQCALFWKDEDDDLIQFSSEDELQHAVGNMTDETLRIYVTVTGKDREAPTRPHETNARSYGASHTPPGTSSSHVPPPPHHPPHPHGPPPPFHGPWAYGGWKKWKPMGAGGWKGGWKGGLFYGCPWTMGREGYGCGRKGRGLFKHGWDKKMKKTMKMMKWKMMAMGQQKEFNEIRQQVPEEFRKWVRQYVRTWYTQGPDAARTTDKLPDGVGQDFTHWLPSFLQRHYPQSPHARQEQEGEMGKEGDTENAPDCLPPVYYRWLCLFLPRFFWRNAHPGCAGATSDGEDEGAQYPGSHCHTFRQGFCGRRGFGWPGKHGPCKGGKHGRCGSSAESGDSDSGRKAWRKVPKGLRKFVRMSFKQLRKGKGDNPKIKEKATRAGVSKEIQEFVEQVMLEWNAKLSRQHPRVVAKEMMETERTLPAGLQREHFLWMVRFMGRWDAGKCGWMAGWLDSDSSSDNTSGDEATAERPGYTPCPPFPPGTGPMYGPPFMGMAGAPPHGFAMPAGMQPPFVPPPPPPPPMYGCFPPPPPPSTYGPPAYTFDCPDQGMDCGRRSAPMNDKSQNGKDHMDEDSDSETSSSSTDDMVDHVTEGVKKM